MQSKHSVKRKIKIQLDITQKTIFLLLFYELELQSLTHPEVLGLLHLEICKNVINL